MKKKINLLLVHNYYRTEFKGGEDIVFDNEYNSLKNHDEINVKKYTVSNESVKIPFYNAFYSSKHYNAITSIIKKESIDIVHFHNLFLALTGSAIKAAADNQCKIVQTAHNYRWFCPNGVIYNPQLDSLCKSCFNKKIPLPSIKYKCNYNSIMKSLYIAALNMYANMKGIISYIDRFIVMTENGKNILIEAGINSDRIVIKPHFIISPFKQKKTGRKGNYLFIGRVDRLKGIDIMLHAAKKTGIKLNIIGDGPDMNKYKHFNSNDIIFHGNMGRDGIYNMLEQTDYLIMPSLMNETFGLTIIEAMSMGVPVIGTNIGSRKELIDRNRGFLANPDIESLCSAIDESRKISDNQYMELSEHAYKFSLRFNEKDINEEVLSIYRNLL